MIWVERNGNQIESDGSSSDCAWLDCFLSQLCMGAENHQEQLSADWSHWGSISNMLTNEWIVRELHIVLIGWVTMNSPSSTTPR